MRPRSNRDIAEILREIGTYLDMQDVPFKPRAYEKAAETMEIFPEEAEELYRRGGIKALEDIPGIGRGIAERIEELLTTGRIPDYEKLKRAMPVRLTELRHVEGLGPKHIKEFYEKLGVRTLADLERAAKAGKIARLAGFGPKSEENILKSIGFVKRGGGRRPIFVALPEIRRFADMLREHGAIEKLTLAGSARRMKETLGDADLLVVSRDPGAVMERLVSLPGVARVLARGDTKSSVRLRSGFQIDLRVVPAASYGAALNYFTGSKDHNVALRKLAIEKRLKLNEYGLWKGTRQIAGKSEEELYEALGLRYIEPELRENTGEIGAAIRQAEGKRPGLPDLVGYEDLQGDLQTQSDWTDGESSIDEMAKAAAKRGLAYIAITDHTHSLTVTNGLDEKRIVRQWAEIDRVNGQLRSHKANTRILKGVECDILKDGRLDLPDETLAKLDVVGASVHSHPKLSRREQTARIIRAMENPHVDILFHPTGRIVGRRPPHEMDVEAIIGAAKRTGTALEANASERLDLKDEHIRLAARSGVKIAINSDAHSAANVGNCEFGIAQARRGWAERSDIINAWTLEKMRTYLKP